jgi:hypothetical protein
MKMQLVQKNDSLFAINAEGQCQGEVITSINGRQEVSGESNCVFARVFEGHGTVIHQDDNPPNPFFVADWDTVFSNPSLLPSGAKNVFIDQSGNAMLNYRSIPVV